nr:C744 [uncultured bacterium]
MNLKITTHRRMFVLSKIPIAACGLVGLFNLGNGHTEDLFDNVQLKGSGYIRENISIGFEDHPERSAATGKRFGGKGDILMQRHTALLEGAADFGWAYVGGVARFSREEMTPFLKDLQRSSKATAALFGGEATSYRDVYDEQEIRELYVGFNLGERVKMTLGKQQVVWGESDGFQAMDVIHGYDFSWRYGLEGENEELRKPLILANAQISIPELDGTLQLIFRPGWDKADDIGYTVDLYGGRWAAQPNHGVDTLALIPYNPDHPYGDTDHPSYGFRWTGILPMGNDIGYGVGFYRGPKLAPVVNSIFGPYGPAPKNGFAEFINPIVNTYGISFNAYSAGLDATINGELVYTSNEPYNFGFTFGPGLDGIVEKDTVRAMLRSDKQLPRLGAFLRTDKPASFIFQVTDIWIPNFNRADNIVDGSGRKKEHSAGLTAVFATNYRADTINPTVVASFDPTYKGALVAPFVDWVLGDHWRLHTEVAFFLDFGRHTNPDDGSGADKTHSFGQLANQNQANARLTYQF